jgi:hypothetical protein
VSLKLGVGIPLVTLEANSDINNLCGYFFLF